MPWTPKQHKLFEAVAHGMKGSKIPQATAAKMAGEGIKSASKPVNRRNKKS